MAVFWIGVGGITKRVPPLKKKKKNPPSQTQPTTPPEKKVKASFLQGSIPVSTGISPIRRIVSRTRGTARGICINYVLFSTQIKNSSPSLSICLVLSLFYLCWGIIHFYQLHAQTTHLFWCVFLFFKLRLNQYSAVHFPAFIVLINYTWSVHKRTSDWHLTVINKWSQLTAKSIWYFNQAFAVRVYRPTDVKGGLHADALHRGLIQPVLCLRDSKQIIIVINRLICVPRRFSEIDACRFQQEEKEKWAVFEASFFVCVCVWVRVMAVIRQNCEAFKRFSDMDFSADKGN